MLLRLVTALFLVIGAGTAAAGAVDEDAAALDRINGDWVKTFNGNGNVQRFYMEDALLFPGREGFIRGRGSVGSWYYQALNKGGLRAVSVTSAARYRENDSLLYEIGWLATNREDYVY